MTGHEFANEREILYKLFFDMKKDVTELKRMFLEMLQNPAMATKDHAFLNELKELKSNDSPQSFLVPQVQHAPQNLQPVPCHME